MSQSRKTIFGFSYFIVDKKCQKVSYFVFKYLNNRKIHEYLG